MSVQNVGGLSSLIDTVMKTNPSPPASTPTKATTTEAPEETEAAGQTPKPPTSTISVEA
jgi:hypothetical protein